LKFSYDHHKEWDEFVKNLTGGVTIMKTAKGQWVSPDGKLYIDRMIPCRIACTRYEIERIIDFTITHYNQEAVLAYRISTNVILRYKEEHSVPSPPMSRIIIEGTAGSCPECGSTEIRRWYGLGKPLGCIQPKCKRYYENK
jgi:predicted RNA-binding Zn-ribbon protein involved in translation (DUF1610 family)